MPAWRLVLADQLDARASALVIHHQRPIEFRAALAPRALALDNHVIPVGCPNRAEGALRFFHEYRARVFSVGIHQP